MVNTCCIIGCTSRSNKENALAFLRIPKVDAGGRHRDLLEKRRRAWLKKINRKNITDKTVKTWTRVCSKHFHSGKPADLTDDAIAF
ncbi:hypothetical protein V1264_014206 [Littorina saxatilis]|uniref:THAP-type domain-containing protein n=1 Tax=Littorina saxatilis TaxID=31220 RepID=A0AAN9GJ35_9CAEN